MFDNTTIFISIKVYLYLLSENYLLLQIIYQTFVLHFPYTYAIYSSEKALSKHFSFKNTVEVFILIQYTVLNNSTCPRINLADPVSNQNVINLKDQ